MRNENLNKREEDQLSKDATTPSLDSRFNQTLRNVQGYSIFIPLFFSHVTCSNLSSDFAERKAKAFVGKLVISRITLPRFADLRLLMMFSVGFRKPVKNFDFFF